MNPLQELERIYTEILRNPEDELDLLKAAQSKLAKYIEDLDSSTSKTNELIQKQIDQLGKKIDGIKLKKGDKGDQGDRGEQGKTGLQGEKGKDGINGKNGLNGKDGVSGKDGSPDMAEDIRNKLELLIGDERLDAKAIKGLDEYIQTTPHIAGPKSLFGLSDMNLAGITSGQTIQWNGSSWVPVSQSSGTGAWQTPPESVSSGGSTLVFTTTTQPTDVISDGIMLFNGAGYTYAGGQITLINGPTQYIRFR